MSLRILLRLGGFHVGFQVEAFRKGQFSKAIRGTITTSHHHPRFSNFLIHRRVLSFRLGSIVFRRLHLGRGNVVGVCRAIVLCHGKWG